MHFTIKKSNLYDGAENLRTSLGIWDEKRKLIPMFQLVMEYV